ncbi:MAG: hypothetical protein M1374_03970 [Firmicutes bacterium]|nr:hypothetical protein [Bacillota bacterium]
MTKESMKKSGFRHVHLLKPDAGQTFLVPDQEVLKVIDRALAALENEIMAGLTADKSASKSGWPRPKDNLHGKTWRFSSYHFSRLGPLDRNRP